MLQCEQLRVRKMTTPQPVWLEWKSIIKVLSLQRVRHSLQQLLCQANFWSGNPVLISFFNPSFLKGLAKCGLGGYGFPEWKHKRKALNGNEDSPYVKINFPAIIRFKQCFWRNVALGAKSQQNVYPHQKHLLTQTEHRFHTSTYCGHKLWNMCLWWQKR